MEEKLMFYENYYIPLLKKRLSDISVSFPEVESTLLFFKEKCSKLEAENKILKENLNSISSQNQSEYK